MSSNWKTVLLVPILGCLPAVFLLSTLPFLLTQNQAEGFWIPLLAYIPTVLIWALLSSIDFISSRYKSIETTLKDGRQYQIGCSSLVLAFLAPYIVGFALKGKWNEVATALAAVVVTVKHMIRTSISLRQIEHFQKFTDQCLDTLKFMGYSDFQGVQEDKLKEEIRLKMLVNEELIDNSSTGGELNAQCHFANGVCEFRSADPVDVYVRWATMFLASCGASWLRDFGITMDDDGSSGWNAKQQAFARNLWESCLMHVVCEGDENDKNGRKAGLKSSKPSNQMSEDVINIDDDAPPQGMLSMFPLWLVENYYDKDGIFSKTMVIRQALSEGNVLPYRSEKASTASKDDGIWVGPDWRDLDDDAAVSFKPYSNRIRRLMDGLPVHFHLSKHKQWMSKISYKSLEWFLVYLHLFHKLQEQTPTDEKAGWTSEDEESEVGEDFDIGVSEKQPLFGRS